MTLQVRLWAVYIKHKRESLNTLLSREGCVYIFIQVILASDVKQERTEGRAETVTNILE